MNRPLYVEIGPLLDRPLTGVGRFTARLVEALSLRAELRLFTTLSRDELRARRLSTALCRGDVIALRAGSGPPLEGELDAWVGAVLRRPHVTRDEHAAASPCLYTLHRPARRYFRREISVIYDFTPLLLPRTHLPLARTGFAAFVSRCLPHSDKAVAISHSTKADAAWLCALNPDDVVVAYPGPSLCVDAHAAAVTVERSPRLALVVSTREPRKNAAFLVEWFRTTTVLPADLELCWVGPSGWLWDVDPAALERGGGRRRVNFVGEVSDARLCELYRRASFTIYPSLYEGFGLPVLDALLHGTPVVCSFNSALAEFAGPGVYFFDACDTASLDEACQALARSAGAPVDRPELRVRCSWEHLAATVLDLCGVEAQSPPTAEPSMRVNR